MEENVLKNNTSVKKRNSNLELFRIITMLFIVSHHYVVNSGLTNIIYESPINYKSIFLLLFGAWGKTGINCFVLITGYFMCKSTISLKKFLKLVFEIEFYRILIFIIFMVTGYSDFSFSNMLKAIFPITSIEQNFTGSYLVFYLFIPFLNKFIKALNKKEHLTLISLLFFFFVCLGSIPKFNISLNYVSWFIILYLFAAYIRLYPNQYFKKTKLWGWLTFFTIILASISIILLTWLGVKINQKISYFFVADVNKIFAVLISMFAFLFFKNLNINPNNFINSIAASTFGVFLIHANSQTMREWLWVDFLKNISAYNTDYLIPHAILSVMLIYILCTLIDFLRIELIEKPLYEFYERLEKRSE